MPEYKYSALDHKGETQIGYLTAADDNDAMAQIRALNLYPNGLELVNNAQQAKADQKKINSKSKGKKVGGSVNNKTLMIFTRQLATLIDAGLPLTRGLEVLAKQEPNPLLRHTVNALRDSVQSGSTFSEGLAQHPKIFNKLFVNMVKAGELGGVLELVLLRLAEYQEKSQKLKGKIVSAMVYPLIVLCIAVLIMAVLMLFIIPKFKTIFEDSGTELNPFSAFVFGFSDWFFETPLGVWNLIPTIVVIVGVAIGFKSWLSTKGGRRKFDSFLLKVPLIGPIQQRSAVARFSRTLGTLVTSGVPILQALGINRETSSNVIVSEAISKIHDSVKEGETIVTPMSAYKVFPPMMVSMVDVGEETGQLPEMLMRVADVYDDEVDNAVDAMTSMLEPLMIVFLAVVVGGIVIAMFLPLMQLIETMGK